MLALDVLSKAVHRAEPEGFIRSFVDEGAPMEALLSKLRELQRKDGPTLYLDTVLEAFPSRTRRMNVGRSGRQSTHKPNLCWTP